MRSTSAGNNWAEGGLDVMNMKLSGGCSSMQGAKDFATLRIVLSTAHRQCRNRVTILKPRAREAAGPAGTLTDALRPANN